MRSEAMSIVSFLTRHHMSQALFRKQSEQHSKGLQLKKPAETHFAYLFTATDRLAEVKLALERLMTDEEYKQCSEKPQYDEKAEEIRELIQSRRFWRSLTEFTGICKTGNNVHQSWPCLWWCMWPAWLMHSSQLTKSGHDVQAYVQAPRVLLRSATFQASIRFCSAVMKNTCCQR